MTLSTSGINRTSKHINGLRSATIYLIISVCLVIFGAIYEYFSHGVYSYFMIYAFVIPLLGGALPDMIRYSKSIRAGQVRIGQQSSDAFSKIEYKVIDKAERSGPTDSLRAGAIITLTIGSIMQGILEIYGTTNRLVYVYPVFTIVLIGAALLTHFSSGNRK